ncbi:MAG TPA: hypothetical protein VG900_14870 [Hyphomicrobiaceae bacterium]|jgi:uncharacterized iron-regulated membrane protein|nr:hypothetical protein [Hyphomicrobiaceae bacterium]
MSWFSLLLIFLVFAGLAVVGLWGYRTYVTGETGFNLGAWFGPRAEPRLGISEQAAVDNRRRLVLVRRDDVEHLIMTGGPVDVVIETNIAAPRRPAAEAARGAMDHAPTEPAAPVFSRTPRSFGQAVNE